MAIGTPTVSVSVELIDKLSSQLSVTQENLKKFKSGADISSTSLSKFGEELDKGEFKLNKYTRALLGLNIRSILASLGIAGLAIQLIRFVKESINAEIEIAKTTDTMTKQQELLLGASIQRKEWINSIKESIANISAEVIVQNAHTKALANANDELRRGIISATEYKDRVVELEEAELDSIRAKAVSLRNDEKREIQAEETYKQLVRQKEEHERLLEVQKETARNWEEVVTGEREKVEIGEVSGEMDKERLIIINRFSQLIREVNRDVKLGNLIEEEGIDIKKRLIELRDRELDQLRKISAVYQSSSGEFFTERELLKKTKGGGFGYETIEEARKHKIIVSGAQKGGIVTRTGLAIIHAGEEIIPVSQKFSKQTVSPVVNITFNNTQLSNQIDVEMVAQRISRIVGQKIVAG